MKIKFQSLGALLCLAMAGIAHAQVQISGSISSSGQIIIPNATPTPTCAITTASEPNGQVGTQYTGNVLLTSGCSAPVGYTVSGLPPGISNINPGTGVITGTPTTPGSYQVQFTGKDSSTPQQTATITYTIVIAQTVVPPPSCQITPATEPNGQVNASYSGNVLATANCTSPILFSVSSGNLPNGTTINSTNGQVVGIPTLAGTFNFSVKAVDSSSPPQTATPVSLSIVIAPAPTPCTITITTEPAGVVSSFYTGNAMQTANCTAPLSFSTSSTVPGLTMSTGNGQWTGTPTTAGNYQVANTVTDSSSPAQHFTATLTIPITSTAPAADNRYCSSSETWTGPASDGPAAAPLTCVRTALADMPATGSTVTTTAGSCSSIQNAINAATPGTTIVVPHLNSGAQDVVSSCQLTVTTACSPTNWCVLTTDNLSNLPAEGVRITPAWIGIPSLPGRPAYTQPPVAGTYLPKILGISSGNRGNNVIAFNSPAAYWLVRGWEITSPAGTTPDVTQLVQVSGSNHIVFVQDIIHGGNNSTGQSRDAIQGGLASHSSNYIALTDSSLYDVHCISGGVCQQAQGVELGGSSTVAEGPMKIVDNYLESSGEVIFAGGGGTAGQTILQVSDSEIRRNQTLWPLFWKQNDPSYFGTLFELDNQVEFKNAQRVFIEGNIFSNTVGYQGSQHGQAIVLDPKSQSNGVTNTASSDGSGTLTRISGGSFTNGGLSSLCNPINGTPGHCHVKYNGVAYAMQSFISANQITVSPAPPVNSSASTTECFPGLNPLSQVNDIIFRYNYIAGALNVATIAAVPSDCGDGDAGIRRISWHDTVSDNIASFWGTSSGSCCAWVNGFELTNGALGAMIPDSILINHNTVIDFLTSGVAGAAGVGPSLGEGSAGNVLTNVTITNNIVAGGYGNPAHSAQFYWQTWVPKAEMCYDHNFHMQSTSSAGQGPVNANFPLPAASDSGACTFTPTGNTLIANYTAMQFTNFNGGIGGDYTLLSSSPGHNAASDGLDVGANIAAVNAAIAGAGSTSSGGGGGGGTGAATLSASQPTLTLTQGTNGTDTITITPSGGFTGSITLAASGLPTGVTAAFGTNPATSTSVLTFTASATAATGTKTITITGTSGSLVANATITLTVNAASTGGGPSASLSWTLVPIPAGATQIDDFAINQNNNHWMITDRKAGVFVATNGNPVSPNWTQVNSGLPTNTCGAGAGTVCGWTVKWDQHDGSFIVCIYNAPNTGAATHFFKTTNDGGRWVQLSEPAGFSLSGNIGAGSYDGGLMPPVAGGTMLLGGIGCSNANPSCVVMGSTTDGSTTFSVATNPAEGKSESFGLNGTTFGLGGEAAGFFTSTDGGHTFTQVWNCGGSVGPSCSNVNDSNEVYTNQPDANGNWLLSTLTGVWRSSGPASNPTGWTHLYTSNQRSRTLYIDSLGTYYFGQAQASGAPTVERSTNQGAAWTNQSQQIGNSLEAHRFIENQADGDIYALIENGSTNAGAIWKSPK